MKRNIFFLVFILGCFLASPAQAYYSQLTPQQIQAAIKLGKMYRGNVHILLNNLMIKPAGEAPVSIQVFTPFNQLVFLAASGKNVDDKQIQEITRSPRIYTVVYGDIPSPKTEKNSSPGIADPYLEVEDDFFSRDIYGASGLSGPVGRQIYNTILQTGPRPYEMSTYPAAEISPASQINYYLPAQENIAKNMFDPELPEKITLDLGGME